jgi:hypothetical protein
VASRASSNPLDWIPLAAFVEVSDLSEDVDSSTTEIEGVDA